MNFDMTVFRVARGKKPAKTYVERHEHEYFHYMYALSGRAMIEVDYNQFSVEERTLILVPPRVIHAVYSMGGFVGLDINFFCDDTLTARLAATGYCIHDVTDYEDTLLRSVFYEALLKQEFFEDSIDAHMLELVLRILRRKRHGLFMTEGDGFRENPSVELVPDSRIRDILGYIDGNLDREIRIPELARRCNYNESYFSTYFKQCVGCPPQKYINRKKIEKAMTLMMSGDRTITRISEELGFSSIHYFSRVFKKELGVSPSVYLGKTSVDIGINIQKNQYTLLSDFESRAQEMC